MNRDLLTSSVVALVLLATPALGWAEVGSGRGSNETWVLEFGELRAGEKRCRPNDLPRGAVVHSWPSPDMPRGTKLWGSWFSADICLEAEHWTRPSGPQEVEVEITLNYFQRGTMSPPQREVPGVLRFEVNRPLGFVHFGTIFWFPLLVLLVALILWRRRPGFERNLHIAYRVEAETGYRTPGQMEWQFVTVESLPGGKRSLLRRESVELDKALAPEASLKTVLLEPFPGEEVMVRASMPMLVQAIGEPTARTATNEVTISPGMVVRAGRLLFALLTPEILDSVQEGRVSLPTPGSGGEEGRESVVEGLRARLARRQPGLWGWLLLAFGPAVAGLLFGLTGLVTNAYLAFLAITAVMILTVAMLQQIRSRLGTRRSRAVPETSTQPGS